MTTPTKATTDTVYQLPGHIVMALMTGRGYLAKLTDPGDLSVTHVKELLRLVGDLIDDRYAARTREIAYKERLRHVNVFLARTHEQLEELAEPDFYGGDDD